MFVVVLHTFRCCVYYLKFLNFNKENSCIKIYLLWVYFIIRKKRTSSSWTWLQWTCYTSWNSFLPSFSYFKSHLAFFGTFFFKLNYIFMLFIYDVLIWLVIKILHHLFTSIFITHFFCLFQVTVAQIDGKTSSSFIWISVSVFRFIN